MEVASSFSEVSGEGKHLAVMLLAQQQGVLWEPDVIAYSKTDVAKLSREDGELCLTGLDVLRLREHNVARNVDIEEVLLAVACAESSLLIKAQHCIIYLLTAFNGLSHGASDHIGLSLLGNFLQHGVGLTLVIFRCWLLSLEHVLLGIRCNKHLWKHYDLGSVRAGLPDHFLSPFKIVSLVTKDFQLAEGHFELCR